jgi:hypothetical protein
MGRRMEQVDQSAAYAAEVTQRAPESAARLEALQVGLALAAFLLALGLVPNPDLRIELLFMQVPLVALAASIVALGPVLQMAGVPGWWRRGALAIFVLTGVAQPASDLIWHAWFELGPGGSRSVFNAITIVQSCAALLGGVSLIAWAGRIAFGRFQRGSLPVDAAARTLAVGSLGLLAVLHLHGARNLWLVYCCWSPGGGLEAVSRGLAYTTLVLVLGSTGLALAFVDPRPRAWPWCRSVLSAAFVIGTAVLAIDVLRGPEKGDSWVLILTVELNRFAVKIAGQPFP